MLGSVDYMQCNKTRSVTVYITKSAVRTVVLLGSTSYIHTKKPPRLDLCDYVRYSVKISTITATVREVVVLGLLDTIRCKNNRRVRIWEISSI